MAEKDWNKQGGGSLHLHALLYFPNDEAVDLERVWRWWFKRFGRAKVSRVDARGPLNAAYYVSKYVLKADGGAAEWDFVQIGLDNLPSLAYISQHGQSARRCSFGSRQGNRKGAEAGLSGHPTPDRDQKPYGRAEPPTLLGSSS
jgi:hypothetical protein